MQENQMSFLNEIRSKAEELAQIDMEYWQQFSSVGTWQFWVIVLTLLIPLIILFIFIERRKILLLGFYGLNFHVWIAYVDSIGLRLGFWEYPYKLTSVLPSFSIDAALIPVSFILVYQWTLNHKKNIYLYSLLLSAIYAFVLKPLMNYIHFFHMFKGINYLHLFFIYAAVSMISILITNFFLWLQRKGGKAGDD